MKNEKGITLIALIITLVVMVILAGITINIGSKEIKKAELQDLVTNMLLIQAKVKIGIEEVEFKKVNLDETNEEEAEEIKKIKSDNLLGKPVKGENDVETNLKKVLGLEGEELKNWYYLTNEDLKEIGLYELMNVNNENKYFIYKYEEKNLNDIEIIYTGGYVHTDKETYYKLSDLEKLQNS